MSREREINHDGNECMREANLVPVKSSYNTISKVVYVNPRNVESVVETSSREGDGKGNHCLVIGLVSGNKVKLEFDSEAEMYRVVCQIETGRRLDDDEDKSEF